MDVEMGHRKMQHTSREIRDLNITREKECMESRDDINTQHE